MNIMTYNDALMVATPLACYIMCIESNNTACHPTGSVTIDLYNVRFPVEWGALCIGEPIESKSTGFLFLSLICTDSCFFILPSHQNRNIWQSHLRTTVKRKVTLEADSSWAQTKTENKKRTRVILCVRNIMFFFVHLTYSIDLAFQQTIPDIQVC